MPPAVHERHLCVPAIAASADPEWDIGQAFDVVLTARTEYVLLELRQIHSELFRKLRI